MEMKLILVDSDETLRFALWNLLQMHHCFRLQAELETADEVTDCLLTNEADVVFINKQPADPSRTSQGTYVPLMLEETYPDVQVVLYSDNPDDGYEAWRTNCAGFLLLPPDPLDIHRLVNRLRYIRKLQLLRDETTHSSLMVKTRSGFTLVKVRDILFIERINRICRIITEDGQTTDLLGYTITQLEEMLKKRGFFRCHQSFLVNLSKVSVIRSDSDSKYHAIGFRGMDGEIAVSREKYMQIVSMLRDTYAQDG